MTCLLNKPPRNGPSYQLVAQLHHLAKSAWESAQESSSRPNAFTIFIWALLWGDQWRGCMVCFQSEYGSQFQDTNYQAAAMGQLITLIFLQMPLFQKHLAGKSWRSQQLKLIAGVLVNGQRMMRVAGGLQITNMGISGLGIMTARSGVISCLCRVLIR